MKKYVNRIKIFVTIILIGCVFLMLMGILLPIQVLLASAMGIFIVGMFEGTL